MARVLIAASSLKSPANPGIAGMMIITRNLRPFFTSSNASIYYSRSDEIVDRLLLLSGGSDEELVFDVYEMLGLPNHLTIGILNTMLGQYSTTPVGAASDDLGMDCSLVAAVFRM